MSPSTTPSPPRCYPTKVAGVQELALTGHAELAPWSRTLEPEGRVPYRANGRAELMLLACSARYFGKPFTELSLSIHVSDAPDGSTRDGLFLLSAFQSVPFFAWVEREVFGTPYAAAEVRVDLESRPSMELVHADGPRLAAAMGMHDLDAALGEVDRPSHPVSALWEGPVHLPGHPHDPLSQRHFFARLSGPAERYAFRPAQDEWSLEAADTRGPWSTLASSGFTPTWWSLRRDGVHEKSLTRKRRDD